jgi:hypothetical protein
MGDTYYLGSLQRNNFSRRTINIGCGKHIHLQDFMIIMMNVLQDYNTLYLLYEF